MLRLKARAKINWSLDILGRREDGYHLMDMLMACVELGDELTMEPAETLNLRILGNDMLPADNNLVLKAARALQTATGTAFGASLELLKHAPVGAGMGGGSADAAAALVGLNRLWNLNLPEETLMNIGLSIGADVPFLLTGGLARVGGIGEVVHKLPDRTPVPLVIIQPCRPLSTKEVFETFDALGAVTHPNTTEAQQALLDGDLALLSAHAGNVLQQASEAKRPQISEAVAALDACGAVLATMTGSGSAVFGAFQTQAEASEAYRTLHKRWRKCWLTTTSAAGVTFA